MATSARSKATGATKKPAAKKPAAKGTKKTAAAKSAEKPAASAASRNMIRNQLIGHALSDAKFREALFHDPKATLEANDYPASPQIVKAIKAAEGKLDDFFKNYEDQAKAASNGGSY